MCGGRYPLGRPVHVSEYSYTPIRVYMFWILTCSCDTVFRQYCVSDKVLDPPISGSHSFRAFVICSSLSTHQLVSHGRNTMMFTALTCYKIHAIWPLLLFSPYWALHHPFPICCADHASVSQRQWYPVQYPSTKLTNSLLSPWPLSRHFEQQQPRLLFIKLKCSDVMCLMVKYEFDSSVHNPSYYSGVDRVLGCFGTVHSIKNKTWLCTFFGEHVIDEHFLMNMFTDEHFSMNTVFDEYLSMNQNNEKYRNMI